MRTIIRTAVLSLAVIVPLKATAQDDVWVCTDTLTTGFRWTGNAWVKAAFSSEQHTIKVNGYESSYSVDGHAFPYQCRTLISGSIRCDDKNSGGTILIDPDTGKGAISELRGATSTSQNPDSVSVSLLRCHRL